MAQFRTDTKKLDGSNLVTRYEVMMLSDRLSPSGTLTDAFGRLRVSQPYTLFDSQHRFQLNGKFNTTFATGGTLAYSNAQSSVLMSVNSANNAEVVRESKYVMTYQPGKSLLIMNTFVFNSPKTGLRQRVGYFGVKDGIFLEQDGDILYLVLRSNVTGTVIETRVAQSDWNIDKFDGTGYSHQGEEGHGETLDISKTNIFWIDIEWLGVGDVRCGFVVNGALKVAHIFHNDNVNTSTYMSTACLPIRYEIKNTATQANSAMMKQICSSVISEGGYEPRLEQFLAGGELTKTTLSNTATYYNLVSLRLRPGRLDSVVKIDSGSVLGESNQNYMYKVVINPQVAGLVWQNHSHSNNAQYSVTGSKVTGGRVVATGYITSVQGSIDLRAADVYLQIGRTLGGNSDIITLAVQSDSPTKTAAGMLGWVEPI